MRLPRKLILLGYWDGPHTRPGWPSPADFVDPTWDEDERYLIADYLQRGLVVRAWMGYSCCRFCGQQNGALDLSDGHFVWPEGLTHYVAEHAVRLPANFVAHVHRFTAALETAEVDEDWWRQLGGVPAP